MHVLCNFTCGGGLGDDEQLAFRKWFRHIGELRSMFPSANVLAVSATSIKEIRRTVMKELWLQKESNQILSIMFKKIDSSIELFMQWLRIPWNWGLFGGQLFMPQVLSRCQIFTFFNVVKNQCWLKK